MKKLILHAREYAFPALNLPEEISDNYDVRVTETLGDSTDFIGKNKGIEGFVLGVIMRRGSVSPNEIDEAFKRKQEFLMKATQNGAEQMTIRDELQYRKLFDYAYSLLNGKAGIELFNYLNIRGYVGKTPILFLTTLVGKGNTIYDADSGKGFVIPTSEKIGVIAMPEFPEKIINWFNKNLPLGAPLDTSV